MSDFHSSFVTWFYSIDDAFAVIWYSLLPYVVVACAFGFLLILAFFVFSVIAVGLQMFGYKLFVRFSIWLFKRNLCSLNYKVYIQDAIDRYSD